MDIISVSLLSHHVTESAKHKLVTGFINKQKICTKLELKRFHYTVTLLLHKTIGGMQDDWERGLIKPSPLWSSAF